MIHALAALPALFRHARVAALILALLFAAASHLARLSAERRLERCRGEARQTELRLQRADEAIERLRRESARRAGEQARLAREAKQHNTREKPLIEALRRSAGSERDGEPCPLSETLRRAEAGL